MVAQLAETTLEERSLRFAWELASLIGSHTMLEQRSKHSPISLGQLTSHPPVTDR